MYRLAYMASPPRVPSVPHFPYLKESLFLSREFAQASTHIPKCSAVVVSALPN
jgi:hypothetical protein